MWKQKLGIAVWDMDDLPAAELVKLVAKIGFNAVSPSRNACHDLVEVVRTAREVGLAVEYLHAPLGKAAAMWSEDRALSRPALQELLDSLEDCRSLGIPTMVVHVWIGFEYTAVPTEAGLQNFDALVNKATAYGVKIAFENTEGEEFLAALMDRYAGNDTVGFCWDSGHEMCYNHSQDMLAKYGDRLLVTHLNDNLGIRDFTGETISWLDDLHLLPYDGIADWAVLTARLKKARRLEYLNFELNMNSKPDRHDNDLYRQMGPELFFTEAYKRACRIASRYAD